MVLAKDEKVLVYPHGSPDKSAVGTVLLISSNQKAAMIAFDDKPPFVNIFRDGVMVHPAHGLVMMVQRYDVGPWIEITNGGHYEIEGLKVSSMIK